MSDFFEWNPEKLSVHVSAMDDEHQILIKKMNALHAAHVAKVGRDELGRLVSDLGSYTAKHFADEEAYMARIGYEGLEMHKLIHKKLLEQLGEHVTAFGKTGVLGEAIFPFLSFWLTAHIRGIDRKYTPSATAQPHR